MSSLWASDTPIRSELFSAERLEQHAESLATAQRIARRPGIGRPLAARLRDNDRALLDAYRTIAKSTHDDDPITPAAEWLVDNFHVVEAQIREIRDDLPPAFYRQLPKLADGPFAGYLARTSCRRLRGGADSARAADHGDSGVARGPCRT